MSRESTIKKPEILQFIDRENSAHHTLRTLTLFGKNSATYKFALSHSLMQLSGSESKVHYSDLQHNFLKEVVNHYAINPHQFVKRENELTRHIDLYLHSEQTDADWQQLNKMAEKKIFNDVFKAFQNVGSGTIAESHRLFIDHRKEKAITLTDNLLSLLEQPNLKQVITDENQARWNIVEEAWRAGLSPNMLVYNREDQTFSSETQNQRINLRSAVDTLLPYQNGCCFYCNRKVSKFVLSDDDDFADVDHFLPHSRLRNSQLSPDGVWNLVIACKKCNRGSDGKFDLPPATPFYDKLLTRNVLFFEEHKHSLKNSISLSLQITTKAGIKKRMQAIYNEFESESKWQPKEFHPL
ncbi:HNH endonuclease [Vibrio sp. SS-MA-C1-2]|uniref:HNH endonuclease n=1 Tax=Vibrio sp. SS-MA-C1-2 TaxID=2908646 RepID=UPI001F47B1B1|nr:HNH endonuclease domain-containing protein [Vibrio sp. SS-MA-C1-2]UJF17014.1 HNH endonuclease [Vibrio sp. SS-MA-C1-2]